ncbi:MAG: FAD-binding oxidoreductase [Alphaproteobacteria bacterium]
MTIFTGDFKEEPYWWDAAPRPAWPERALPSTVDVAVVGSGYTGLSAALTLARNGREPFVFEAGAIGEAASTRSAGHVGRQLKWSFSELVEKYGADTAAHLYREMGVAQDYLKSLIESEQIACQFYISNRYLAAHSPRAYEKLAKSVEPLRRDIGLETTMVPRAEQHKYVGSDGYYGGQVVHGTGMLHAALYHQGLLDRVVSSGVTIAPHARVTNVARDGDRFVVSTVRGRTVARNVILATNAHTGPEGTVMRHLRRRLIPVRTYAATTETLPKAQLDRIIPSGIPVIDTHKVVFHIQWSPDATRIIMGGKAGRDWGGIRGAASGLHAHFTALFPDLRGARLSHAWDGYFAFTFDYVPHIGVHEGVHYALGCCATGVPMGTYLGHKIALKVIGHKDAATVFDNRAFPTMPLYTGDPWFVPAVMSWYDAKDRLLG